MGVVGTLYWVGFVVAFIAMAPRVAPGEDLPFRVIGCAALALIWPLYALAWLVA